MKYYLRFTNDAKADLERGTSVNASDLNVNEINKEDAAAMFGCDENSIEEVEGCWYQILDGICGYELEADNLEDAIEEVNERNFQFNFVGRPVIFKGEYAIDGQYVADGDLFTPESIEAEL
jgi:hypothetical protein